MPSKPTPRFVDDYLPALLGRASAAVPARFHAQVRAMGLSLAEWRVLASLAQGEPMSTGMLAQVSLTKGPTATRLLDRMQAKGHVERIASDGDRRVTLVRISVEGQKLADALIALAREQERQVLEEFGLAQAGELKDALRRLLQLS